MADRSVQRQIEARRTHVAVDDPVPAYRIGLSALLREAGYRVEEPRSLRKWLSSDKSVAVVLAIAKSEDFARAGALGEIKSGVTVVALLPTDDPNHYVDAISRSLFPVLRNASEKVILSAVETAILGHVMLPRSIARALLARMPMRYRNGLGVTPEQEAWLQHLAQGLSVESLVERTGYSRRELFRRLRRLYAQLGAANRSQALIIATQRGIIPGTSVHIG